MVVKRFNALSCAKMTGVLYAFFGLVFGAIISLVSIVGGFASPKPAGALLGVLLGIGAVFFLPVFYGGIGFLFTFLAAMLYNTVARLVGGIEFEVDQNMAGTP